MQRLSEDAGHLLFAHAHARAHTHQSISSIYDAASRFRSIEIDPLCMNMHALHPADCRHESARQQSTLDLCCDKSCMSDHDVPRLQSICSSKHLLFPRFGMASGQTRGPHPPRMARVVATSQTVVVKPVTVSLPTRVGLHHGGCDPSRSTRVE